MEMIYVSVRELVEFLLRSGDIDQRKGKTTGPGRRELARMQEGSRIHREIQRRMSRAGVDYNAEVPLKYTHVYQGDDIVLTLDGRADGIFEAGKGKSSVSPRDEMIMTVDLPDHITMIDEIKGVYRDVKKMNEPEGVHLAQAKCYAAMLTLRDGMDFVGVRMTYCSILTREIKCYLYAFTAEEIREWFEALLEDYRRWAVFVHEWRVTRQESIKALTFPYEYRPGQKELAAQVYRTIYHKKRLFLEAPTGVGKTISTLFPAVKAVGEDKADRIFYLTAKSTTAGVAHETYEVMAGAGLKMKVVRITAREKLCLISGMEERACDPDHCPVAAGHFDRVNEAMYELLTTRDNMSGEVIREHAEACRVCPYELCLDLTSFADIIIGDYNYVFDPDAALRKFFGEGVKGEYIFLVDEAHNLVERAREMYSAKLFKADIIEAKRLAAPFFKPLSAALSAADRCMIAFMDGARIWQAGSVDELVSHLGTAMGYIEEIFDDERYAELSGELTDFYFEIRHFLNMASLLDKNYVIHTMTEEDGRFSLNLFCVNPSENLRGRLETGVAGIFFSATLLPVTYYIDLLSGDRQDYAIYAPSPFDPKRRGVFVATDVSSRYKRRGAGEYLRIARYIHETVRSKKGKYMVFFPSYRFLEDVLQIFKDSFDGEAAGIRLLVQTQNMTEREREDFLQGFYGEEESLLGFCVLGGVFSEGIDLKEDMLIGAVIVGTGIPKVGERLDILKDYFDKEGQSGYDYAYRIPGMNKVLQAAGRVIRTVNDRGIILLLDDRFAQRESASLFPREWENITYGEMEEVLAGIRSFWDNVV